MPGTLRWIIKGTTLIEAPNMEHTPVAVRARIPIWRDSFLGLILVMDFGILFQKLVKAQIGLNSGHLPSSQGNRYTAYRIQFIKESTHFKRFVPGGFHSCIFGQRVFQ